MNVEAVRELAASGVMLTSDKNVVRVEMNVQYTSPIRKNMYGVTSPDDGLRRLPTAPCGVIGKYTMDRIHGRWYRMIGRDTQRELEETIRPYDMGIALFDMTSRLLVRRKK